MPGGLKCGAPGVAFILASITTIPPPGLDLVPEGQSGHHICFLLACGDVQISGLKANPLGEESHAGKKIGLWDE